MQIVAKRRHPTIARRRIWSGIATILGILESMGISGLDWGRVYPS